MKTKDKVKSRLSLWSGDKKIGEHIHVMFPETDKHYAYQQSFNGKDLIVVESNGY